MCIDYNDEVEAADNENEFVSQQMEILLRGEYNPELPEMIEEALCCESDMFYQKIALMLKSGDSINDLVAEHVRFYCESKAAETAEEMYDDLQKGRQQAREDFLIEQAERN